MDCLPNVNHPCLAEFSIKFFIAIQSANIVGPYPSNCSFEDASARAVGGGVSHLVKGVVSVYDMPSEHLSHGSTQSLTQYSELDYKGIYDSATVRAHVKENLSLFAYATPMGFVVQLSNYTQLVQLAQCHCVVVGKKTCSIAALRVLLGAHKCYAAC